MIDVIESKITDVVNRIIDKPVEQITKEDYDILVSEYNRLTFKINSENQSKRMAELMASVWAK